MHAFTDDDTRLIHPITRPGRLSWRRRRIRSYLRRFGCDVAARVTGSWVGLIKALHESRRRSAARLINQHRHLIDEHGTRHASPETRPSGLVEP